MKKIICFLCIILLSGCDITYNLDISDRGFVEDIDIIKNNSEELVEYEIPAFFGEIGHEDVDANFMEKMDNIKYYKKTSFKIFKFHKLNYTYKFDDFNVQDSNLLNLSFDNVVIKKYDHDSDGKNDYMLFSTDNSFRLFEESEELESVKVNIICHYEVISSNADEVDGNVYTWYLKRDNLKPINMVFNPDKSVDYRNLFEKIFDGEYLNIFTVSVFIFIVGYFIYRFMKKRSSEKNVI